MKEREVLDGIELPDDMPRLSDTDLFTNTRNWHPRLESLDRMITEFPYMRKFDPNNFDILWKELDIKNKLVSLLNSKIN